MDPYSEGLIYDPTFGKRFIFIAYLFSPTTFNLYNTYDRSFLWLTYDN